MEFQEDTSFTDLPDMKRNKSKSVPLNMMRDASILTIGQKAKRIKINVGGEVHETHAATLLNIPDSPLAWIMNDNYKKALDHDAENGEIFFDRHPGIFEQVLDYFQTGKLHSPRNVCGPMFQEELRFWGIEEQQMECCCWHDYTRHRETQEDLKIFDSKRRDTTASEIADVELGRSQGNGDLNRLSKGRLMKMRMWKFLDEPASSSASKFYAWVSLVFIVLSIVSFTINGTQVCQASVNMPNNTTTLTANQSAANQSMAKNFTAKSSIDCGKATSLLYIITAIEITCAVWFTLELVMRTAFCSNKKEFFQDPFTILDILAVIMSYVLLASTKKGNDLIWILNMARFFRISRFFKNIYSLQVLGKSFKASAYQFLILLFLLLIPVILFSSLIYYTEQKWGDDKSKISLGSIPLSFWWAVVTMTTAGYGDAVPVSIPGLVIGGVAAVFGVIILSLTSSIIGSTFQQYYNLAQTQLKIPNNRQNQVHVPLSSLQEMAGMPGQEYKPSINSSNSKSSGRDSGYGTSPVTKK